MNYFQPICQQLDRRGGQPFFKLITLLCLLVFTTISSAAKPLTTPTVDSVSVLDSLVVYGFRVFESQGEKQGHAYFEKAMQRALLEQDKLVYLQLVSKLGRAYYKFSEQPEQIVAILQRIDELPFEVETKEEIEKLAYLYTQLGWMCTKFLSYQAALKPYKKAFDLYENSLNDKSIKRAKYLEKYLGNVYTRLGDYAAAEVHLQRAYALLVSHKAYAQARWLSSDLAVLYQSWGKSKAVEQTYAQAFALPLENEEANVFLYLNYVDFLLEQHKDKQALSYLTKVQKILVAKDLSAAIKQRRHELLAAVLEKRALVAIHANQKAKAVDLLHQAIANYNNYYGNIHHREIAKLYNEIAELELEQGHYLQTIKACQQALSCTMLEYQEAELFDLPEQNWIYAENTILESLQILAQSYELYYDQEQDLEALQKALTTYELVHYADLKLRQHYLYESSKLSNLDASHQLSESAIAVANKLYQLTQDEHYIYQAFVFAENNRSALLQDAIKASHALGSLGLSETDLAKEQALVQAVSDAYEERYYLLANNAADSLLQAAKERLQLAKEKQQDWLNTLALSHPNYYKLRYKQSLADLSAYQAMLGAEQLLIEYFLGEQALYVFLIDENGIQLKELSRAQDLEQQILAWRKSISDYQNPTINKEPLMATYIDLGHQLYNQLLADVLPQQKNTTDLLIIPNGILNILPFEALLTQQASANTSFTDLPYLLQDYTCTYTYSANLYQWLSERELKGEGLGAFAPSFDAASQWSSLSCSAALLKDIELPWQKDVYLAQQANSHEFKQQAAQYQLLHLATHAQANAEFGDFSFIVFHKEGGGYDSLFAKDLYLLNLDAELVVLSACETAIGTLHNSEGVISLARAFQYAGAKSVLTTLWSINEGTNCELLDLFYKQIAKGDNKAQALRAAKLAYLEEVDSRSAHPVYWAAFQFSGNPRPLPTNNKPYLFLAGAFLLSSFGVVYYLRTPE